MKPLEQLIKATVLTAFATTLMSCSNIIILPGNAAPANQTVLFDNRATPINWKLAKTETYSTGTSFVLIPQNETMANWTQSIRTMIIQYDRMPGVTAFSVRNEQIADAQKRCGSVHSKILAQTRNSIFYTLDVQNCPADGDQRQIAKGFNGDQGVQNVMYSGMTNQISQEDYNQALALIRSTKLIKNPQVGG